MTALAGLSLGWWVGRWSVKGGATLQASDTYSVATVGPVTPGVSRELERGVTEGLARTMACGTWGPRLGHVWDQLMEEARKLVDFDLACLSMIDSDTATVRVSYQAHDGREPPRSGLSFPLEETVCGLVAKTHSTLIREDMALDSRTWTEELALRSGLRSEISVPLMSHGALMGTLSLVSYRPGAYGAREQELVEGLVSQIGLAVENSLLHQEVKRLALGLESIGDAVVFCDTSGNIQFVNRAARDVAGVPGEEMLGKPVALLAGGDPERRAKAGEMVRELIRTGTAGGGRSSGPRATERKQCAVSLCLPSEIPAAR